MNQILVLVELGQRSFQESRKNSARHFYFNLRVKTEHIHSIPQQSVSVHLFTSRNWNPCWIIVFGNAADIQQAGLQKFLEGAMRARVIGLSTASYKPTFKAR
jgi:hypothetical protein